MKRLLGTVIILSALLGYATTAGQTKRNPFAPLAKTTISRFPDLIEPVKKDGDSEVVELKLNGIIFSVNRPVAIINDTVVEMGSISAGRRIAAISIPQVQSEYRDKKEILKITPKFLFSLSGEKKAKSDIQDNVTK